MGQCLAEEVLERGHEVVVVSGPVSLDYPPGASVERVVSTEEMLAACERLFPACDGLIGVAAPCDYRPVVVAEQKISKTGQPLTLQLIETPDIVATLARQRTRQWVVGFALETEDQRLKALAKLERKYCDAIVLNGPEAMQSLETQVEIIARDGTTLARFAGDKRAAARQILAVIQEHFIDG
jgi:phosphopantothenoylcysteine decarboxylase/phosphopantothenate--cysteine ligase